MNYRTQLRRSTEGKNLVIVTFERESPDADSPMIEVIYEVRFSSDQINITAEPTRVLRLLSSTRTDTRTTISLTQEEEDFCAMRASEKSLEYADF